MMEILPGIHFGGHSQTGAACRNKGICMNQDHGTDLHFNAIHQYQGGPKHG